MGPPSHEFSHNAATLHNQLLTGKEGETGYPGEFVHKKWICYSAICDQVQKSNLPVSVLWAVLLAICRTCCFAADSPILVSH